jgi:D-alanine-D-alanine ligase
MKSKVLVLEGGLSTEKEVSKRSGHAIANALVRAGYIVEEFDFNGRLEKKIDEFAPDVVFVALHGKFGEDGTVQGMLELLGIPYTGSDVLTSAVCMDKLATKRLFNALGVNTPPYVVLNRNKLPSFSNVEATLETDRVVIKPVDQGSTIGISIVSSEESYKKGIEEAFSLSNKVIAEKFISGTEITVSVIGSGDSAKILPIIEIVPENDFYDYESKYTPGMSHHIIPARISKRAYKRAEELSLTVYREFGVRDFGRVDLIVDKSGEVFVLEVNTIPGFTETSLLPDAASAAGIKFETLVSMIVQFALSRSK